MNQNQIQQLTSHLSQALDQNYDVVNLEAVLSVICALEGTTITKEQLEATRLAKYINHLRRRTKNEQLARRAKSLLKRWREMVGIQQTATDSQPAPSQPLTTGEVAVVVVPSQQSPLPLAPPQLPNSLQKYIADTSSEQQQPPALPPAAVSSSNHMNFSNLINNIAKSDESKPYKFQRESSGPIIDHSSNSVSNSTAADRFTDAAIVIDIVSDSNDNDGVSGGCPSAPPTVPVRNKKLKKDKRRRDRESQRPKATLLNRNEVMGQQSRYATKINCTPYKDGKVQMGIPTDAEILSLSNSSMSSILSGDVAVGNSHSKTMSTRPNSTSELTFAGRFKSVSQPESSGVINGHQFRANELPITFEDSITNDSNTSCSRLSPTPSPFPFEERRKALEEADKQQIEISVLVPPSTTTSSMGNELGNRSTDYTEGGGAVSRSSLPQIPKKRGRKKGSKGVDSIIAKESSSLSQQILFGAGVKKVKTTKELFNDLQSRKLSNVIQSANNLSNASSDRDREEPLSSRSLQPRPTSSCSEASMHSPQIQDTYSSNITLMDADKFSNQNEDPGNTDSDTITSEPSRDSIKSREVKGTSSLDSNSNTLQTPSATTGFPNHTHNDVTTQLMHLVHSLGSPPSVSDTERLYQTQIVPCTCIVLEEEAEASEEKEIPDDQLDSEKVIPTGLDSEELLRDEEIGGDSTQRPERTLNEDKTLSVTPQKPIKSIFDLDFDEDDDPLQSIIKDLQPATVDLEATNEDVAKSMITPSTHAATTTGGVNDGAHVQTDGVDLDQDGAEVPPPPLPVFTVHEDPNCLAKERFLIQTNKVTNFHINALHNYCVPNINGNWDVVETASTGLSDSLSSLELYAVTDGADVVPKYGSLTFERIPKDLSSLKFGRSISRTKTFKSYIPPFLGVAKCLPTCRRANRQRRRVRDSKMQQSMSPEISCKQEDSESPSVMQNQNVSILNKSSPSPLQVDVNVGDNIEVVANFVDGTIDPVNHNNSPFRDISESRNSYNLLKLANDDDLPLELGADAEIGFSENRENSRCSSSSSSNSSLIKTQQSINAKLKSQQLTDQYVIERNRKKRRKTIEEREGELQKQSDDAKPRIKRIKIAINGTVTSQRQISNISSSNNSSSDNEDQESDTASLSDDGNASKTHSQSPSEDEHESSSHSAATTFDSIVADEDVDGDGVLENEYENSNDEEYAIVQRPMGCGGSSNHIVLTIKKTPSKINSPANSISGVSPITGSESGGTGNTKKAYIINMIDPNTQPVVQASIKEYHESVMEPGYQTSFPRVVEPAEPVDESSMLLPQTYFLGSYRRRLHRLRRRRSRIQKSVTLRNKIDIELNHLFNCNNVSNADGVVPSSETKLHRKLFFNDELCRQNSFGQRKRIIDYSSSSSSSSDDDDDDGDMQSESELEDNSSSTNEDDNIDVAKHKIKKINIETDTRASAASTDAAKYENEEDSCGTSSDNDEDGDDVDDGNNDADKPDGGEPVKEEIANVDINNEAHASNELPLHNNGMLPSFNSICVEHASRSMLLSALDEPETNPKPKIASLKSLKNENCDDVNNLYYNNNNLDIIKNSLVPSPILNDSNRESVTSNTSSIFLASDNKSSIHNSSHGIELIRHECQTGIRPVAAVALDKLAVKEEKEEDSSISQIHQFKEWHQVLQLPSYNDEPLIVLPYIVLE